MPKIELDLTDEQVEWLAQVMRNAELDTIHTTAAAKYRLVRHQLCPPSLRPFKVDVSRAITFIQHADVVLMAEDRDHAEMQAEELNAAGSLVWLDREDDVPTVDSNSVVYEISSPMEDSDKIWTYARNYAAQMGEDIVTVPDQVVINPGGHMGNVFPAIYHGAKIPVAIEHYEMLSSKGGPSHLTVTVMRTEAVAP